MMLGRMRRHQYLSVSSTSLCKVYQYAPMATRLAGAGVLTVVMHYSLFPGALVPDMVDEVSAALSWTLNHCAALGGDPSRVRF